MPDGIDNLLATARRLQGEINDTLDLLKLLGVVCHSVSSFSDANRFAPISLSRVALVLEMKSKE